MHVSTERIHNRRLSSIEGITESTNGRKNLKRILFDLFQDSVAILFYGERPNFNESIKSELDSKYAPFLENIEIFCDNFRLHFKCESLNDFKMGLESFIDFYFYFENSTFVFVSKNEEVECCFNMLIHLEPSWEMLSNQYECEVLFRGSEECALWRGHS